MLRDLDVPRLRRIKSRRGIVGDSAEVTLTPLNIKPVPCSINIDA